MKENTSHATPATGADNNDAATAQAAALQPHRRALAGLLQGALVMHRHSGQAIDADLADLLHNIPFALVDEKAWQFFCAGWDEWQERAGPFLMANYAAQVAIIEAFAAAIAKEAK